MKKTAVAKRRRGKDSSSMEETTTPAMVETPRMEASAMVVELLAAPEELTIVMEEEPTSAMEEGGSAAAVEEEEEAADYGEEARRWRHGSLGREAPPWLDSGIMKPRTQRPLVLAAYQGLSDFQRGRVQKMGFGPILEIEPFYVDSPLIQALRERWDRNLLGLEPKGDELGDRRMVDRVELLESLGLRGVRQRGEEMLQEFVQRAAGLARAVYGQDPEDQERVDRDLRRFLVFFLGKMLLTTKGDDIHCRFLEILEDLERVRQYAWGAAFLAHTFADLSSGTGRETTMGGFAPFLQVWSYNYIPLGRATEVRPDALPLARRWLPIVTSTTFSLKLDTLRRDIWDFPEILVVWQPYVGMTDDGQPWVESGRPRFGRDLWVHCLNEIEPLCLRLEVRTLGVTTRPPRPPPGTPEGRAATHGSEDSEGVGPEQHNAEANPWHTPSRQWSSRNTGATKRDQSLKISTDIPDLHEVGKEQPGVTTRDTKQPREKHRLTTGTTTSDLHQVEGPQAEPPCTSDTPQGQGNYTLLCHHGRDQGTGY
ncbi:hypothetical protein Taro_041437 [Colocasia esculenta]|uniref:Aminotransferase-like plant mobile domain-containing protein n=1 Tax=Colocasia esculenta TaxID=4460 RepID=A0A843WTJ8_COLES|nr:hypothetical protein [Colocasia esculenta]